MNKQDACLFISRAKALGIIPNFWLSEQYLQLQSEARLEQNERMIWVQEGDFAIFPPLPKTGRLGDLKGHPKVKIWSDFANYSVGKPIAFLDWEYSYRSDDFNDLPGKEWAVFRKNIRKWPKANPNWEYVVHPSQQPSRQDIEGLLIRWLEARPDMVIEDDSSFFWFALEGKHRAFLFKQPLGPGTSKILVGMNVWDEYDDRYLIYRYCLVDPEESFLDEFLRYRFYQFQPHKIVIDGGTLGNPGLERFKDRLNPFRKRNIFSKVWKGESRRA